jgi:hypothetical protein
MPQVKNQAAAKIKTKSLAKYQRGQKTLLQIAAQKADTQNPRLISDLGLRTCASREQIHTLY